MTLYDRGPEVIERSLAELREIFAWVNERQGDLPTPTTILIGAWAVDAYNPYVGSVDIDSVTNSNPPKPDASSGSSRGISLQAIYSPYDCGERIGSRNRYP